MRSILRSEADKKEKRYIKNKLVDIYMNVAFIYMSATVSTIVLAIIIYKTMWYANSIVGEYSLFFLLAFPLCTIPVWVAYNVSSKYIDSEKRRIDRHLDKVESRWNIIEDCKVTE